MAISYSLDMATTAPATQVAHELSRIVGADDLLAGARTERGTWVRVIEAKPRPWNPVTTDLGFTPNVSVVFRLDKEDINAQQDDMVRAVSSLLGRILGDAVLHSNYEDIWLVRRSGELMLSEQADLWPSPRLAAVVQPYRRETHVFSQQ